MRSIIAKYGYPVDKAEINENSFNKMFSYDTKLLTIEESQVLFESMYQMFGAEKFDLAKQKT